MRLTSLVTLSLGVLAACSESNTRVNPVTVQWMDWPAEVNAGQAFRTRLVVWGVCAANPQFHPGASVDQSAVTFAPYWVVDDRPIYCLDGATAPLLVVYAIDTAGTAPGLAAPFARTYEMRASAYTGVNDPRFTGFPARTFGDVIVRPSNVDQSRRNAAGAVSLVTDTAGCVRVRPGGLYNPAAAIVLEDQADTVGLSYAFVRGYIYDAAAPVCGETRVFHITARE